MVSASIFAIHFGGLAQLARALAWHARGRRFDPDTLHHCPQYCGLLFLWNSMCTSFIQRV